MSGEGLKPIITREEDWAVMWLREEMLAMPDTSFWWAITHPFQWAERYAEFKTLERVAGVIERREHHPPNTRAKETHDD